MSRRLTGKVAIVTGASAGIGWASARVLAEEGADLVITARRQARLNELSELLRALGVTVETVAGDAREEETAIEVVAAAKRLGGVHILVNNAGAGIYKDLADTSAEEYDFLMDTNVRSTFLFVRHVVPEMIAQGEGNIQIISSVAGRYGFKGESVYCATKFAQVGFAQALDNELREKGIKVGIICPGGVKTEFAIGHGRTEQGVAASGMLESEDVAEAVRLACTQPKGSRIIEIRMRPMSEPLA